MFFLSSKKHQYCNITFFKSKNFDNTLSRLFQTDCNTKRKVKKLETFGIGTSQFGDQEE